jgi:hypothetical protein
MIQQTRKFGIAPVLSHQKRDQLKRTNPNHGATLGMGSYLIFQVTYADAAELSREMDAAYSARARVYEPNPLRRLDREGHHDPVVTEAYDRLQRVLVKLPAYWNKERQLDPSKAVASAKMQQLDELMRQYLTNAMRGVYKRELVDQAWMVPALLFNEFYDALDDLAYGLKQHPLKVENSGLREQLRQDMTQLDPFMALTKVATGSKPVTRKIATARPVDPDTSWQAEQRLKRLREASRQYTKSRAEVEADINLRRQPPQPLRQPSPPTVASESSEDLDMASASVHASPQTAPESPGHQTAPERAPGQRRKSLREPLED